MLSIGIASTLLVALLPGLVTGQGIITTPNGVLNYTEDWGYVNIRPYAHTFWWLFKVPSQPNRPLILWLQGGPGADSTGFGNFEELGPLRTDLTVRNSTWLQLADLVFVDNPVGAGFSYTTQNSAFTTNVEQIGADLVNWAKAFFAAHPEYQKRPFYLFCESYGGKMTAEFGKQLQDAIDSKAINVTLAAINLGDSWISPLDFVDSWGEYLYATSYLDGNQLAQFSRTAAKCRKLASEDKWSSATDCWGEAEEQIGSFTDNVDWYNILSTVNTDYRYRQLTKPVDRLFAKFVKPLQSDAVDSLMNGPMRKKFGIIPPNLQFGAQSGLVFQYQSGDFMKSNYDTVDNLLNRGKQVNVYNGQLDLICNTVGVEKWLPRLTWTGLRDFLSADKKTTFSSDSPRKLYGFHKSYKNLGFYYVLKAGHMVPADAPWPALDLVKRIISA